MFPNLINTYNVKLMEQRELVAAVTERSRHMTAAKPAQGTLSISTVRQIINAALDRIVLLLPDSRDKLRSKEQELAASGLTWATDPAHDEMLARQIESARLQRRAGCQATQISLSPATSGPVPKGSPAPQPAIPAQA
jgi:hypothetical protein